MRKLLFSLLLLPLLSGLAFGQARTQQDPTRLDVATAVAVTGTAVNNQYTATITVPAGQYAYITAISFDVCTNGTGTAANQVTFTSTNLSGSPVWPFSVAATASICQHWTDVIPGGYKSAAAGTNVTIVTPAAAANNSYTVRAYYYLSP